MVGFINGGREAWDPDCSASAGTSIVLLCAESLGSAAGLVWKQGKTYVAIFELEDQLRLCSFNCLVDELGGYPAQGRVRLPRSRPNIVGRCHEGEAAGTGAGMMSIERRFVGGSGREVG